MKPTLSVLAGLLGLPALALAHTAAAGSLPSERPPYALGVGLGVSATDSPYAGEGTRINPLPLILLEGDRFFFRGNSGGVHLYKSAGFTMDAIAALRMDGIDKKDFGSAELALNGIDRALLEDRDDSLDLGLSANWATAAGQFEFTAKADVTGASEAYELSARYGYDFRVWGGHLTPSISVNHLSKDMANYYYGTLDEEVARGVVDYKPDAVTIPTVGITYVRPIGEAWTFMGRVQYSALPDEITDSPLLERDTDGVGTIMIGFSRSFW